jgi:hypothetical protein
LELSEKRVSYMDKQKGGTRSTDWTRKTARTEIPLSLTAMRWGATWWVASGWLRAFGGGLPGRAVERRVVVVV